MGTIYPDDRLPRLRLTAYMREDSKYFRIESEKINPKLLKELKEKKLRLQLWLEREHFRKNADDTIIRGWFHNRDCSIGSPRAMYDSESEYMKRHGWGRVSVNVPSYVTTNGFAPTEHEISEEDIKEGVIVKDIAVIDIFTSVIRNWDSYPSNGDSVNYIKFTGGKRNQPIRYRLMGKREDKILEETSVTNVMVLGVHHGKNGDECEFDSSKIQQYIKISNIK